MKTKYCALFIIVLSVISVRAQYQIFDDPIRYSLYFGASFPTGEFANALGAKGGVSVSLDATANIYKNIKWLTSTNMTMNGIRQASMATRISASSASSGQYTTGALLTGPYIQVCQFMSGDLFVFAQTGLQILFMSDIEYTKQAVRETLTTNMGAGYAYSLGVTTKFTGFNVSFRYQMADPQILERIHTTYPSPASTLVKKRTNSFRLIMGINL